MNDVNDVFNIPTIPKDYKKNSLEELNDNPTALGESTEVFNEVNNPEENNTNNVETLQESSPSASIDTTVENLNTNEENKELIEEFEDPLNKLESTPEQSDSSVSIEENITDSKEEQIAPFAFPPNESSEAITLNPVSSLPDTLEQDYGVISDNDLNEPKKEESKEKQEIKPKKEKKPKEKSPKKKKSKFKIVLISIIVLVLVLFGAFGFLAYKFYFTLDPVTSITSTINALSNSFANYINKNDSIKLLKENDGFEYNITFTEESDLEKEYKIEGSILKSANKFNAKIKALENNEQEYNVEATLLNNAFFIKLLDSSYYYRMTSSNEFNIGDLIDNFDINKSINNYISIIEKNINKGDFSSRVMRIKPNDKVILVNKYSLKISGSKVKDIIKEMIDSESDPNIKILLEKIDYRTISEKVIDLDVYVSLKKLEKIDLSYNGHNLTIVFNNDNYTIKYDNNYIDLNIDNNSINVNINDDKNINISLLSSLENKVANQEINVVYKNKENETKYNYSHKISVNDDVYVPVPFNIKDYETEEGKISYESEKKSLSEKSGFFTNLLELKK